MRPNFVLQLNTVYEEEGSMMFYFIFYFISSRVFLLTYCSVDYSICFFKSIQYLFCKPLSRANYSVTSRFRSDIDMWSSHGHLPLQRLFSSHAVWIRFFMDLGYISKFVSSYQLLLW